MQDIDTYRTCQTLLSQGQYNNALALSRDITLPEAQAGILIDAGFSLRRSSLVQKGIGLLQDALLREPASPLTRSSLLHNLANGYLSLFTLRSRKRAHAPAPPNDDNLRAAKEKYREALDELIDEPSAVRSQIWVNYGNCYHRDKICPS